MNPCDVPSPVVTVLQPQPPESLVLEPGGPPGFPPSAPFPASGSTDPYNTSTNKAPELTLYIVDPAAPTTSCQATAVIEQSSSSNTAVFAGETLSNPGPFSFNNTQAPGDGRYFLCGYVTAITANGGSGGTEAMASAPVTIAPVGTPTPSSGKRHRPTRAQRLSAALKKCAKLKRHSTRAACVSKARRIYGAKHH